MLSLFVDRIIVDKAWSCFIGSPPMTARGCSQQVRAVNHCTAAVGRCRFCAGISQGRSGLAAPLVQPSGIVKCLRSRLGRRRLLSARPAELRLASRAPLVQNQRHQHGCRIPMPRKRSSYAIRPNTQHACADGFWICRQSIAFLHAQRLQLICFSVSGPRPTDSPSSAGLLLPARDVPESANRAAAGADPKAVLVRTNGAAVANVPVLLVSLSLSARLAASNPR